MSMMKAQSAKAPAKTMSKTPAQPSKTPAKASKLPAKAVTKLPAKAVTKAVAKAVTKAVAKTVTKAVAKTVAKAPAKAKNSREAMLARVEAVRLAQREEGHFDCFGRAGEGYCDQGDCSYHAECLSVSRMLHSM